jgi:hypothetical protein
VLEGAATPLIQSAEAKQTIDGARKKRV